MRTITREDVPALEVAILQRFPSFSLMIKPMASTRCTTWGSTVYIPTSWGMLPPATHYIRLKHEAVHLEQFARLGKLRFLWQYARNNGRYLIERDAFAAEMAAVYETQGADVLRIRLPYFVSQFTGNAYWYCCDTPGVAQAWVDAEYARIVASGV